MKNYLTGDIRRLAIVKPIKDVIDKHPLSKYFHPLFRFQSATKMHYLTISSNICFPNTAS